MVFRLYSERLSKATRGLAAGIFIVGMLLVGFGVLIIALPELFAMLAAMVFFIAGLSCIGYTVRLFCAFRKMDTDLSDNEEAYRENVTIHMEEHFDE